MAELKNLKIKRGQLKAHLKRFERFLETSTVQNSREISERLEKFQPIWKTFHDVQAAILEIRKHGIPEDDAGNQQIIDNEEEDEIVSFEESYFRLLSEAKSRIPSIDDQNVFSRSIDSPLVSRMSVKLPTITLPTFDGQYNQWMQFKDGFRSIIDENESLTDLQRLQYLRGALRGEALQFIEGMEISEANYRTAWELLTRHYENARLIVSTHLKALFETVTIVKCNSVSLRQLVNHVRMHTRSLSLLRLPIDQWDAILIYLTTNKLDYHTRKEWEDHVGKRSMSELPGLQELLEFLCQKYHTLEMIERERISTGERRSDSVRVRRSEKPVTLASTSVNECEYCKGAHRIFVCDGFLKLPVSSRIREAKRLKLCFNCLRSGHWSGLCKSSGCKVCGGKHNTRLHAESSSEVTQLERGESVASKPSVSTHCAERSPSQVLLSTARVYVYDSNKEKQICRVLLDPGSQSNIITRQLVSRLQLPRKSISLPISGINQNKTYVHQSVSLSIESLYNDSRFSIECLVLPKITEFIPSISIETSLLTIPDYVRLADEEFYKPDSVDLLIGAGLFWRILKDERVDLRAGPRLQNTRFGWILGGELLGVSGSSAATVCHVVTNGELSRQLERLWQLEEFAEEKHLSPEEALCEEHFVKTVSRKADGRFEVGIPQRQDVMLGDTYEVALHRLYALERRFARQPEVKQEYVKFMEQYESLEHMTLIESPQRTDQRNVCYLPHHAVIKQHAITSKLRVVFDASARSASGVSLNHKLLVGPTIQDNLVDILIRFRLHQIVLTADIEMMYRQILVREQDRDLQRILWRTDVNEKVQTFRLNTVTYGTSSASFLAVRCLKELAIREEMKYPVAAKVLQTDFYMDDLITGAHTQEEACVLQKQLKELLHSGGMNLRKWRTNDCQVLDQLDYNDKVEEFLMLNRNEILKTLGLLWNSERDSLVYRIEIPVDPVITKRRILSSISRIFDPLGLLGPILTTAKLLMQQLWKLQLGWDAEIPSSLQDVWWTYYGSLKSVTTLEIVRNANPRNLSLMVDIHGFSDASEKAYGACVYVHSVNESGCSVHLLCSKSRVAPLKSITLPRLELNAAWLLAKLFYGITRTLKERINSVTLWTDSTIVLNWINLPPYKLKTYVANRVADIQRLTSSEMWRHVPTKDNPADLLSRGVGTDELKDAALWWHGPRWLPSRHQWPSADRRQSGEVPDLRNRVILVSTFEASDLLLKYSSIMRLQRVVAYCLRFIHNLKEARTLGGPLAVEELSRAMTCVVKLVQRESFGSEIENLRRGLSLHRRSKLLSLRPFLDDNGVLRVGGRLRHADVAGDQRHPILLPSRHGVTTLILKHEHERLLHCGPEQLLSSVRLQFWPLSGRREARKVTRSCIECFRLKPIAREALMADLPKDRVQGFARPFSISGVDYAGPIQIREGKRRGRIPITKAYIAVFVCFSTKAVHLEAVTDLTSEAFLAALRRFTARRGLCGTLYSDNATTFVGASRELREIYQFLAKHADELKERLAQRKITWKFIPPRSPNFGGLWEASVKAVKKHLYTVTRDLVMTYEEFATLLAEIESVLNSRPLTSLSSSPDDLVALTPAHFLLGEMQSEPAQESLSDIRSSALSRWQHQQQVRQHFWRRWQKEYLHQLQMRTKWHFSSEGLQPGAMVLVMDEPNPPLKWPLARVLELHPGDDGVARVATIRTSKGIYKRSVRKLCALPMDLTRD